jgi:cytochrome c553
MKQLLRQNCLAITLSALAMAAVADESWTSIQRLGAGDPQTGKAKAEINLCEGCHGDDGKNPEGKYPNLAGQFAPYILKQIADFRSGERPHPVMTPMAGDVRNEDLIDIAAFFASRERMTGHGRRNPLGHELFANGDWQRNIAPCKGCHGVEALGSYSGGDTVYPLLAGQHRTYLREQLLSWRDGSRANSPGNIMGAIAHPLTDHEIEALADYLSGL